MIGVGTCKISKRAKEYVNQVLDSNRLSYGPFIQEFERRFASIHDSRFAIMSNSGTCALQIALAALKVKYGWQDGDEVIVPAVTFIATSNIVLQLNMVPVFVDVDPIYYEVDPEKIEAAITEKTRCIIPVHLFGLPCDMDPIVAIAEKYELKIIEDSCETMFARYKGKPVGSFGAIGCFSTYVAHLLVTGVGGLSITSNMDLATSMRSLINHGRDAIYISIDDDKNVTEDEFKMIVGRRFSFVQMGYSYRVTEMEGALGLAELEQSEDMIRQRKANAQYLSDNLKDLEEFIQLPSIRPNADHVFMMYPVVVKNEKKDDLVQYLETNGIETRDLLPLINQPYYKNVLNIKERDYPVAKWINESGFYIASHQGLSASDKKMIVQIFHDYFDQKYCKKSNMNVIMIPKPNNQMDEALLKNCYDSIQ